MVGGEAPGSLEGRGTPVEFVEFQDEDQVAVALGPDQSETIAATLDDLESLDSFLVALDAGDELLVTVDAATELLDLMVTLRDSDGDVVAINDDAPLGADTNSFLDVVVVRPDTYTVEVNSFLGLSSGDYEIELERMAGTGSLPEVIDELPDLETSLSVASGETVAVEGSLDEIAFYELLLSDGDQVTISVESADPEVFDPQVVLLFGEEDLGINDDSFEDGVVADIYDSHLVLTTGNTGLHAISVFGFQGSTGDFTLTVSRN